ncbi:hypothetical protein RQP46_008035 [Phenoliferia psychrophenolica]
MDSSLQASSIRSLSPPPSPYTTSSPPSADASAYAGLSNPGSNTLHDRVPVTAQPGGGGAGASSAGGIGGRRGQQDERRDKDAKADQIVQHFYAKTCAVVSQARMTHLEDTTSTTSTGGSAGIASPLASGSGGAGSHGRRLSRAGTPPRSRGASAGPPLKRTNRWFNLELSETDHFRQELKTWRSVSSLLSPTPSPSPSPTHSLSPSASSSVPPMVLDIILDTCGMTPNQVLVLSDQRGRRVRVDSSPSPPTSTSSPAPSSGVRSPRITRPNVILERWTLSLVAPFQPTPAPELPSVYKQAIVLFRTLFTLIGCRMSMGDEGEREGEVDVEVPIAERSGEQTIETFVFPGVQTPIGTLVLKCAYRLNADFAVEAIETLLSSTFIDQDFFKPTMARYHQDALSGRPGSLPIKQQPYPAPPNSSSSSPQRPSYGSLSSRHQRASTTSTVPFPSIAVVQQSTQQQQQQPSSEPETPPESAGSSGRYGSFSGGVEPAFLSLSRARGASYSGGIQRAVSNPLSSSPTSLVGGPNRRPSLTSASGSSSSPIFRPGPDPADSKRFLESAEDDSDAIESFLGLIDARPELVRTAASAASAASAILSKTQADDHWTQALQCARKNSPTWTMFNWLVDVRANPLQPGTRRLALVELWEMPLTAELIDAVGKLALRNGGKWDVEYNPPPVGEDDGRPLLVSKRTNASSVALHMPHYIRHVLARTQVHTPTLLTAIIYLGRMVQLNSHPLLGSGDVSRYRLVLGVLRVAAQLLSDFPSEYADWRSCGDTPGGTVNLERDVRALLGGHTSVTEQELLTCLRENCGMGLSPSANFLAPPETGDGSDDRKDGLRLLKAANPHKLDRPSPSPSLSKIPLLSRKSSINILKLKRVPLAPITNRLPISSTPSAHLQRRWTPSFRAAPPKVAIENHWEPVEKPYIVGTLIRSTKVTRALSQILDPAAVEGRLRSEVHADGGKWSEMGYAGEWIEV